MMYQNEKKFTANTLPCVAFTTLGTCVLRNRCKFIHDPRVKSLNKDRKCIKDEYLCFDKRKQDHISCDNDVFFYPPSYSLDSKYCPTICHKSYRRLPVFEQLSKGISPKDNNYVYDVIHKNKVQDSFGAIKMYNNLCKFIQNENNKINNFNDESKNRKLISTNCLPCKNDSSKISTFKHILMKKNRESPTGINQI